MKARFVYYKKRYVRCNILHFIPATENVIEKNTSQNSFGSLGSGVVGFPQFLECLEDPE